MLARTPHRLAAALLALALLAGTLGGCMDDEAAQPEPAANQPKPTRVRPTKTPKTATPARPDGGQADWTVLVYLDGDNDLEAEAIGDFAEMASVGSNERLNIIVQFDRIKSDEDWDDSSSGNWQGVKRFRVEQRKKPTKKNQLEDLGELNMGDPATVVDFAAWGIATYPARHYALIFWDHGAAWPGIASDDSSDGDMLTLPELTEALAEIQRRTGVEKLDLIGFDACLMSQIDVLGAMAPFGHVAIGSADLEPGEGWAWNAWLKDLANDPPDSAAELAPSIIKSFTAFYEKEGDSSVTLAAFDLDRMEELTARLDTLAGAMIDSMPKSYKVIGRARTQASEYASGDTDISAVDLGQFVQSLLDVGATGELADAAAALGEALQSARIVHGYGDDHPDTSGISVYFPRKKKHYDADYPAGSPLTQTTRWDDFLQVFYKGGGRGSTSRSAVSKPELSSPSASADEPLRLEARISGDETAYVYYFIATADPDNPDALRFSGLDYIYPPGATPGGDIPAWADGDEVQLTWGATSWYISNGEAVIAAPFTPVEYGSMIYSVDGVYTSKNTGSQTSVSVEFRVEQGRGALEHIWAFDRDEGDNPRPRELEPRAGDSFTPDIPTYIESGDDFEESTAAGEPITFGKDPLFAFAGDAPSGDYLIGLMVEDIAGEISDQYAEVTVENGDAAAPPPPPATPAAPSGAAADSLRYQDEELGFQIDYPQEWRPSSPSADKIVFDNPEDPDGAFLGVDVYALEGTPEQENRAILDELLDEDGQEPGFELRQDVAETSLAGRPALRVEYVYQDEDGALFYVVALAVSDAQAGAIYLITFDVAEADAAQSGELLEQMLASFVIK